MDTLATSTTTVNPTTEVMERLLSDSTVLAFIEHWKEHGRCPLPFGDYLEENDYPGAEFARWASCSTEAELAKRQDQSKHGFLHPWGAVWGAHSTYGWWSKWPNMKWFCHDLPKRLAPLLPVGVCGRDPGDYMTYEEAIVAVLVVWPSGYYPSDDE